MLKKIRTKRIHIVAAILDLTKQRGLETINTFSKLESASATFVRCLIDCAGRVNSMTVICQSLFLITTTKIIS